ncbi:MAG: hypothetical protein R3B68_14985 [Phycisphaerales bacterium]
MPSGGDDLPRWYAALDRALDAGTPGKERARILGDVVADLKHRARADDDADHHPGEMTLARLDKWMVALLLLPLLGCVGSWLVFWVSRFASASVRFAAVAAVITVVGLLIWRVARGPIGPLGPPPLSRRCGGCKYDLSGHADAVAKSELGGYAIGPRHCPECGRRWPVVPRG